MPFRAIEPIKPAGANRSSVRARARPLPPFVQSEDGSASPTSKPAPESASLRRKHHVVDRSGPNWDENGDYIVGKGRPSKNTQWKPGQSGNPKGPKPREKIDAQTELDNMILGKFMTVVNGEPTETNLGLFAVNILKSIAATKNRLAAVDLLNVYQSKLRERNPQQEGVELLPEEQAIINTLLDAAGWEAMPSVRNRLNPSDEPETNDE